MAKRKTKLDKYTEKYEKRDREDQAEQVEHILEKGVIDKALNDLKKFDDTPFKNKAGELKELLTKVKSSKNKVDAMKAVLKFGGEIVYSTEEFNKEFDRQVESGLRMAEGNGLSHPMLAVILNYDDKEMLKPKEERKRTLVAIMIALKEFDIGGNKAKVMLNMGRLVAKKFKQMALSAFLISDAYTSGGSEELQKFLKFDEKGDLLPASKQPIRAEAIVCAGLTVDGRSVFSQNIYKRLKREGKDDVIMFSDELSFREYYKPENEGKQTARAFLLEDFFTGYKAEQSGNFPESLIMKNMANIPMPGPN